MKDYTILLSKHTFDKMDKQLTDDGLYLTPEAVINSYLSMKTPQISTEKEYTGHGSGWKQEDISILGDISVSVPVTVYDNGSHDNSVPHSKPFKATLLYVPGAIMNTDKPDYAEVVDQSCNPPVINYQGLFNLYERRLYPVLKHANDESKAKNKQAFITIPGMGCGCFAGRFRGQMGPYFEKVLTDLITKYQEQFSNIKAIYYDPYNECDSWIRSIGDTSMIVAPLTQGNMDYPQLCAPKHYGTKYKEVHIFDECELYSVVAWDHLSWPGNDFYIGNRETCDGVSSAATSSMASITGIEGKYNNKCCCYLPPKGYDLWESVVKKNKLSFFIHNNQFKIVDVG